MKRPKEFKKRELRKTTTANISMPEGMKEFIDAIAEASEVSRSEVVQWVFTGIMAEKDLQERFFGSGEEDEEDEEEEKED